MHAWCAVTASGIQFLYHTAQWQPSSIRYLSHCDRLLSQILGLDKPAVPTTSGVDGEAAAPKLTQAQMEYNKMEAVLKDIEKRGTIRFD